MHILDEPLGSRVYGTVSVEDEHKHWATLVQQVTENTEASPAMLLTTNQTPMDPTTLQPRITPKWSLPACSSNVFQHRSPRSLWYRDASLTCRIPASILALHALRLIRHM